MKGAAHSVAMSICTQACLLARFLRNHVQDAVISAVIVQVLIDLEGARVRPVCTLRHSLACDDMIQRPAISWARIVWHSSALGCRAC